MRVVAACTRSALIALIAMIGAGLHDRSCAGDAFPARPIKLVVPLAAGGGIDVLARIVAEGMSTDLGQQVVIENRSGGGGRMAAAYVAHSEPDGYTLIFDSASSAAVNSVAFHDLPYDPVHDFATVSLVVRWLLVLLINPSVPARTLPEFIGLLKADPTKYSYGSSGVGSIIQLATEDFKAIAGVEIAHIPYRGNGPALTDLLGGRIHMLMGGIRDELGNISNGSVRTLAISSTVRSPALPDLPTMIEAGVPGYEFSNWTAVFAPAATPRPVIDRIQSAIASAVHNPAFQREFSDLGYEVVGSTPEELKTFRDQQIAKYAGVVEKARLRLDDQ